MIELAKWAALIAVLGSAVVYGTDVFCAMVQRPAMAAVDDRTMVAAMGNVHRFGDRRMPLPGVIGIVATAVSAALFGVAGRWTQAVPAIVALALLLGWLVLYLRISAPINRRLTLASETGETPPDARRLQQGWDRIINARAIIQGLALGSLCLVLMS